MNEHLSAEQEASDFSLSSGVFSYRWRGVCLWIASLVFHDGGRGGGCYSGSTPTKTPEQISFASFVWDLLIWLHCSSEWLTFSEFSLFFALRLLLLHLETDRMWMTSIVALFLLALGASAEDKKLSVHATTLADNSANLAFRLVIITKQQKQNTLQGHTDMVFHGEWLILF